MLILFQGSSPSLFLPLVGIGESHFVIWRNPLGFNKENMFYNIKVGTFFDNPYIICPFFYFWTILLFVSSIRFPLF